MTAQRHTTGAFLHVATGKPVVRGALVEECSCCLEPNKRTLEHQWNLRVCARCAERFEGRGIRAAGGFEVIRCPSCGKTLLPQEQRVVVASMREALS